MFSPSTTTVNRCAKEAAGIRGQVGPGVTVLSLLRTSGSVEIVLSIEYPLDLGRQWTTWYCELLRFGAVFQAKEKLCDV